MAFTNGTFETGDLTGWSDDSTGAGTHSESVTVTEGAAITGTYGARFQASADNGGGGYSSSQIAQTIDTAFTEISFDYNPVAITSQSGLVIRLIVVVSDSSYNERIVYNNILDGESAGVVNVTLTKAGDMSDIEFHETTVVAFRVQIWGS